jgi:glycosyltransferase involved in cell wall biosynthesis
MGATPLLTIVMPVYDEAATVSGAIEAVLAADLPDFELIVVDDGSTDSTPALLTSVSARERVRVLTHPRNRGKGRAVRTGLAEARGRFTAILDADLEYEASDLPALLVPLVDGRTRVAFGVRSFESYTSHSLLYVIGNRAVTWTANVLFNVYLRDLMTCHKVMDTALFRELALTCDGFSIEGEITGRLLRRGERVFEIPVHYRARATAEGKKLRAADGLRVVRTLVRCRVERQRAAP